MTIARRPIRWLACLPDCYISLPGSATILILILISIVLSSTSIFYASAQTYVTAVSF